MLIMARTSHYIRGWSLVDVAFVVMKLKEDTSCCGKRVDRTGFERSKQVDPASSSAGSKEQWSQCMRG